MEDMSSLAEAILEQIADAVIYADATGWIGSSKALLRQRVRAPQRLLPAAMARWRQ